MNEFTITDEDGITLIFELPDNEKKWWYKQIKSKRNEIIKPPEAYVDEGILNINFRDIMDTHGYDSAIKDLRSAAWSNYIKDEAKFHKEIIVDLIKNRDMPNKILGTLLNSENIPTSGPFNLEDMAGVVGDFSGRIMPYLYQLSLSTTNSRRSRAGTTFEKVICAILKVKSIAHQDHSMLGKGFYRDNNLSRMVDVVVPDKDAYLKDNSNCAVLTLKTSLRERWMEVTDELNRTNLPHLFLLTLDEEIPEGTVRNLQNYNITLTVYDAVKESKFRRYDNVMGYQNFFDIELPQRVSHWQNS